MSLADLTLESFAPHQGEVFTVGEKGLELVLDEVRGLSGDGGGSRRPFSLLFRGPAAPPLPQRTYPLEHPRLGRLELFLVPLGPRGDAFLYEAVFA